MRKNLLNWLYPDAHDANENMGGAMEAYYDKATGKWVIPGEVREREREREIECV